MRMRETALFLLPVLNLTVGTAKIVNLRHHAKFRDEQAIGKTVAEIMAIFRFLQDGGCLPSRICNAHVYTTHEEQLAVFVTVQNLVRIDTVLSIMCKF